MLNELDKDQDVDFFFHGLVNFDDKVLNLIFYIKDWMERNCTSIKVTLISYLEQTEVPLRI